MSYLWATHYITKLVWFCPPRLIAIFLQNNPYGGFSLKIRRHAREDNFPKGFTSALFIGKNPIQFLFL